MEISSYVSSGLVGFSLFAVAGFAFLVMIFTEPGDATTATLSLAGISCLVGGLFALTLTRDNSIDPGVSECLATSYTYAVSQISAELGAQGNAFFIPSGGDLRQFVPAGVESPLSHSPFPLDTPGCGFFLPPAAAPLLSYLERNHALTLPSEEPRIFAALKEILVDTLEVADGVTGRLDGDLICIDIIGYRLFSGCTAVHAGTPGRCSLSPCPVCSLVACALAKGTGRITTLDEVTLDPCDRSLRLQVRFAEITPVLPAHAPSVEIVPGESVKFHRYPGQIPGILPEVSLVRAIQLPDAGPGQGPR